jgi:hypothetical protein
MEEEKSEIVPVEAELSFHYPKPRFVISEAAKMNVTRITWVSKGALGSFVKHLLHPGYIFLILRSPEKL